LAGIQIVVGANRSAAANSQDDQKVTCPAGMVAIAGGETNDSTSTLVSVNLTLITTVSATDDTAWTFLNNGSGSATNWHGYAVCVHGSETGSVLLGHSLSKK
jgi:hypothetical protein